MKDLQVISGLDGKHLRTISVADNTSIEDILEDFHEEGKGLVTLLRGEQRLKPGMTVSEAGLEDGEEVYLIRSKTYHRAASLPRLPSRRESLDEYRDIKGGLYVQIPDDVDKIKDKAFDRSRDIVEVLMHDRVTLIGAEAFGGCIGLVRVVMSESITSIGSSAFAGCRNLTDMVIPESVTSIGEAAFFNCASMTHVTIPDSVTRIGRCAFGACDSLREVVIHKPAKAFGEDAFDWCPVVPRLVPLHV